MSREYKIAILFLDEIHHIYHFVNVAVELAKNNKVHILTHPRAQPFLEDTLKALNGESVVIEKLPTASFRAFTDKLKGRKLPRKGFWIKKHQKYILNNFDAVLFTDYFHHHLLKARKDRERPKFIHANHGTPGRAYSYNKDLLDFDFHLLYGEFQYQSLKKLKLLVKHYKITGYTKFDALKNAVYKPIFSNNKKTVLYNPHFTPPFSSWHFMGIEILEFFYKNTEYNCIFAPHINLFNKVGGDDISTIPEKYLNSKNIHIDLGSEKSVNMAYVNEADIYLGDVSSQIYEFITTPRPCIFLNPQNINYKNDINYRFWQCGEVISSCKDLEKALRNAKSHLQKTYKPIQEKITSENYYTEEGSTASERSATAIKEYLDSNL